MGVLFAKCKHLALHIFYVLQCTRIAQFRPSCPVSIPLPLLPRHLLLPRHVATRGMPLMRAGPGWRTSSGCCWRCSAGSRQSPGRTRRGCTTRSQCSSPRRTRGRTPLLFDRRQAACTAGSRSGRCPCGDARRAGMVDLRKDSDTGLDEPPILYVCSFFGGCKAQHLTRIMVREQPNIFIWSHTHVPDSQPQILQKTLLMHYLLFV